MYDHKEELDVGLMAGLGGSLDVFAGHVSRAPVSWQNLGLEWLYRLIKQPSRIGRMMRLPVFLLRVIKKRVIIIKLIQPYMYAWVAFKHCR